MPSGVYERKPRQKVVIRVGKETGVGVFGERMKAERIRRNMTPSYLAAAANIHVSQVTGSENRGVMPMLKTAIRIAIVLDCTLDYLCGLENEDGQRDIHPTHRDAEEETAPLQKGGAVESDSSNLRVDAARVDG